MGHCNDKVNQAIDEQSHKLQHMSTLYANEPQVSPAEKLAQITPGRLKKSFFTNSGTEANETGDRCGAAVHRPPGDCRPAPQLQRSLGHYAFCLRRNHLAHHAG